jgi:hypothetical protein
MYIQKYKIALLLLASVLLVFIFMLPTFIKWYWESVHKDYTNVNVSGIVYNNNTPFPETTIYVRNYFYTGGDYDGFGGDNKHQAVTDRNGKYNVLLPLSAFIQVDIIKDGYTQSLQNVYITGDNMSVDIHINKSP